MRDSGGLITVVSGGHHDGKKEVRVTDAYTELTEISRRLAQLDSIAELLGWDQQTQLPVAATKVRAEQRALIVGMRHELLVADRVGDLLAACCESANSQTSSPEKTAAIRELSRHHERQRRIPARLVEELQTTVALSRGPWLEARKQSRFELFAPWLKKLVRLSQERTTAIGYEIEPYDVFLDEYEPNLKSSTLLPVLKSLEDAVRPLVLAISACPRRPDTTIPPECFDPGLLSEFSRHVAGSIGFDLNAGRIDGSDHSSCFGLHPCDVRLLTEYNSSNPLDSFFAAVHETGHGLYHQGVSPERWSTPLGRGASLAVHESQARWWENFVARSSSFWKHFSPRFRACVPGMSAGLTAQRIYEAVNEVQPSLIRVEADEVTYNLHISVRTDLERRLINGELAVDDLPDAWNSGMERALGISPPDDRRGVLQDVHWSLAMFGYFPTYALGNLYAAQLDHRIRKEIPGLDEQIAAGDFREALHWMRSRIHQHGGLHKPAELMAQATGETLTIQRLVDYLIAKFRPLYGL